MAAAGTAGSRTPTSLSLERKNNDVLEFSAPGYTTQRVGVQKSLRGGIVVLDILGGVLPVIVEKWPSLVAGAVAAAAMCSKDLTGAP
ncbi:hypothetical protein [Luteitalea sp.]|uniref:hypothetical protein n=1 Tax=Luteitalea sp. TaxID=2004800 RepID=UPI0025C20CD4|nr:hypothetical protein [Luteitalea sp.]